MTAPSLRRDLANYIQSLSSEEFRQAKDVSDYLGAHAADGASGIIPEGSVASVLNRQSPKIRKLFFMLNEVVASPRELPFQEKLSQQQIFDKLGMNSDTGTKLKETLDNQFVADELLVRLGSDAEDELRNPSEPSTRDIISAAVEQHSGE